MYIEIMLTPSLPKISSDYHINSAQASLILSLYTVFGTAINPIVGKMGDMYGKKKILTYVLIAYCATVTATSFAPNYTDLLITRTFQGIGLGIFPLAFSLVREEFPRDLIPRAQGMVSAMFGAGIALGLPVGAFVANSFGWQANYHIATPFVIILTVVIVFEVKESAYRNPNAKMDYVGAGLLGAALALIVLGLSQGSVWGWHSPAVIGMMVGGFLVFVPLVIFERKQSDPLLNFKRLAVRNVLVSNLIGIVVGLGMLLAFQSIVYQLEYPKPVWVLIRHIHCGIVFTTDGVDNASSNVPSGSHDIQDRCKAVPLRWWHNWGNWFSDVVDGDSPDPDSRISCRRFSWHGDADGFDAKPACAERKAARNGPSDSHEHGFQERGKQPWRSDRGFYSFDLYVHRNIWRGFYGLPDGDGFQVHILRRSSRVPPCIRRCTVCA